jgi:hypothetical protein
LLVIVGLALWGCTGSDEDPGPIDLAGPGEPIADGFVVPDGARLLLAPLPIGGSTFRGVEPEMTWSARLFPEDPVVTFVGLVDQAQGLGFEVRSYDPEGEPCWVSVDGIPEGGGLATVPPVAPVPEGTELTALQCQVTGWRTVDGKEEELWLDVRHERSPLSDSVDAVATMTIQHWPAGTVPTKWGAPMIPVPDTAYELGLDADPTPPPIAPGATLSTSRSEPTLVEGSRPAAPVRDSLCQGGFSVVLDVTGDADDVFEGYGDQIRSWQGSVGMEVDERESTLFGRTIKEIHGQGDDSSDYAAVMVSGPDDEPVRLLYELCGG